MYTCVYIHIYTIIYIDEYICTAATATHCNTLQHIVTHCRGKSHRTVFFDATHCNSLQLNATHCNTLQHTAGDNRM